MLQKLQAIAKINGYHKIREKAYEELNELIVALDENVDEHIIDETADVFIMLYQIMMTYGIESEVYDRIDYKLDRTLKRMGEME